MGTAAACKQWHCFCTIRATISPNARVQGRESILWGGLSVMNSLPRFAGGVQHPALSTIVDSNIRIVTAVDRLADGPIIIILPFRGIDAATILADVFD